MHSVSINDVTENSVIVDANSLVYNGLSTISSSVYSFQVVAVYPSASSSSNIVSIETGELVFFCLWFHFYEK